MNGIKWIIVFVLFGFGALAQSTEQLIKESEAHVLKKLGKNALKQNDPNAATQFFEAYLKLNKTDYEANYFLAIAYYEVRNYEKAKANFLTVYKNQKSRTGDALFYAAQMMKSVGKYDSAKVDFEKFKKEYKGFNKALKKQAGLEINFCDSIQKLGKDTYKTVVTRLDSSVNKVNSESAPLFLSDNQMIFSSLRTNGKEYIYEDDSLSAKKRKIYWAEKKSGKWLFKGEFGTVLNDERFNVGNPAFSADKKRLYFTRCKANTEGEMVCAIYMTEKTGDKWSEPEKLPYPINQRKSTSTMPTIGTDPVKGNDVIYFVSNRRGGKGGFDIWYSTYDKKHKEFKEPKNAGSKINTLGNEMSPFFDHETHSLYFSSNDLPGLGGYDIYKAASDGKRWVSVENLGKPFNSGADDIYYSISGKQHDEGFFVSNRKGGAALANATCCDDIYHYKIKESIYVKLSGVIADNNKKPLANAKVEIYSVDKNTKEKFLLKTVTSDSLGNYTSYLEPNKLYEVVVKKKEFLGKSESISTVGYSAGQEMVKKTKVEKQPVNPIALPNINYEFN
ncbi:MAG: tetratricopeptide repeat protein, partial [Bacteroidota bacterium]